MRHLHALRAWVLSALALAGALTLLAVPVDASDSGGTDDAETKTAEPAPAPLTAIEEQLRQQTMMLRQMQEVLTRQQTEIERLRAEVDSLRGAPAATATVAASTPSSTGEMVAEKTAPELSATTGAQKPDDDIATRVGALEQRWGKLRLTGDFRFRYEGFYNQGFDAVADVDARSRLRVRARAQLSGEINKHFDWGLRLATGNFNDPVSTNQTLSDYYNRKPFAVDRMFVRFNSRTDPVELELVAGKFDFTWRKTPITFDSDLQPEGISESLRFKTGDETPLRAVKLVAWQLPYLERSVGADAVIYGGQIQTDWKWSDNWSSTLNGTFHDFEKVDVLAAAVNVPSTLVNAGFNYGSTNAVFTNPFTGRPEFFSEFRVVDVLADLRYTGFGDKDAKGETRWPMVITADWLRNTSAFDNNKDGGFASLTVGRAAQAEDWQFEYAFYKSERDAFPSVFGESDVPATNSVNHWIRGSYMINRQVMLEVRHMFQRRLLRTGPEDRVLNRLQVDVHYRF